MNFLLSVGERTTSMVNSASVAMSNDPVNTRTAQSTVTLSYQANIAGYWHNITVVWCKNLMNHSLTITVDSSESELHHTCKIDLKAWYFWSRKGYKSFDVESHRVDVHWDFRSAKFSGSPEPCGDYYVALVSEEEVILLLGDYKKKAYKRTKSRPALVDAILLYKKEHVFNKKTFSTRARFDERSKEHEITVESSVVGSKDPEMWIMVDEVVLIHIRNLHWKFRGNESVVVDNHSVQVFWDVHDWLFRTPGEGHGLFIFKPIGGPECESDRDEMSSRGGGGGAESDTNSCGSRYYSTRTGVPDFCLYLYAWKME